MPSNTTTKLNVALEPDAADLLERVTGGRRMAGGYLSRLIRDRWQEWTAALIELRDADWRNEDLRAACDALNGYWLLERDSACGVALELHDAERLNQICERHGVDRARWARHVSTLQASESQARSLLVVAREFWADNQAVERALGIGV